MINLKLDWSKFTYDCANVDADIAQRRLALREQAQRESAALFYIELGTPIEKYYGLQILGPRHLLTARAFFELMRIRDQLKKEKGMELIVDEIENVHFRA